jgi:sec-independent protein translocase protein TatA
MGEGLFSPWHILSIIGIALLLFGPSKFANLGKGLGEGIWNFKSSMKENDVKEKEQPLPTLGFISATLLEAGKMRAATGDFLPCDLLLMIPANGYLSPQGQNAIL